MADIVDRATRSRMMGSIRGRDTQPELMVRRFLHSTGLRFRLHDRRLPGRPDIVLPAHRSVVQVHGCFWHQHPGCPLAYIPASNRRFWSEKLAGNHERDVRDTKNLRALGWRVFTVWECEIEDSFLHELAGRIRRGAAS